MKKIFKDKVLRWIKLWERETMHLSYQEPSQPGMRQIIRFKNDRYKRNIIIKAILEHMKIEESWIFFIFWHIIPEKKQPHIPEAYRGRFYELRDIWLKWGKEHNYIT